MQNCLSTVWTDEWLCITLKTCWFIIELPSRTFIEMSRGQQWTRLIAQGITSVKKGVNTSECEDDFFIINRSPFQWTSWQVWPRGIFPSLGTDSSPSPYFDKDHGIKCKKSWVNCWKKAWFWAFTNWLSKVERKEN